MKVRIKTPYGEHIYDSDEAPIIVEFTEQEKETVMDLGTQNKLISYPEDMVDEIIDQWMHS